MEMKISKWAEENGKRAHGQAGFRKDHSTIDHLVTLQVLMEEKNLWKRMKELQVPNEYMHAIFRIYEKVVCQVRMGEGISEFFTSTIGVKQGCPLSPTLFGLLIDELEHMVLEFMRQEDIEEVMIGNAVIMLLLYADDVVEEFHRLCTLCPQQVRESEYHTLLECSAFAHIRACFPHIFSHGLSLHTFLSQPRCGLSIATLISTILEHRESLISPKTPHDVSFGPIGHI
ncbi:hypothetical protein L7F22_032972 [Adiantum nelumboides]|nr:hypothetical protein [Adiantum nelumboides]